jgi:hypothetical protein
VIRPQRSHPRKGQTLLQYPVFGLQIRGTKIQVGAVYYTDLLKFLKVRHTRKRPFLPPGRRVVWVGDEYNDGVTAICCLYYWFAPDLTLVRPAKLPILAVKLRLWTSPWTPSGRDWLCNHRITYQCTD